MNPLKLNYETFVMMKHHLEHAAESYYSITVEYPNYDEKGRTRVETWHYHNDADGRAKFANQARAFFANVDLYPGVHIYGERVIGSYHQTLINF